MTADRLIEVVQSFGSDAETLRDAAHEAHHALFGGLAPGRWCRDSIHSAVTRAVSRDRSKLVSQEIDARAVEQLVCAHFGVNCGTIEEWANVVWWETAKNAGIYLPADGWLADAIRMRTRRRETHEMAAAVIALANMEFSP